MDFRDNREIELDVPDHVSCMDELKEAEKCVKGDDACTSCFEPSSFINTFPNKTEIYFQSTLAFKNPGDPELCLEANWLICKKFRPEDSGESVSRKVVYNY